MKDLKKENLELKEKHQSIKILIDDLGFDAQRMSGSGQVIYIKIRKILK